VRENDLDYQKEDVFVRVKQLAKDSYFYGYGIVDSTHIFVAYQPEEQAEASAIIQVVDLATQKANFIGELGGTGESFFDYNRQNGYLVFNWVDGIAILQLRNPAKDKSGMLSPKIIYQCQNCSETRWLDHETIAFTVWNGDKRELNKIKFEG